MQFKTKSVKLSDIAIDGGTQQREKINEEIVAEYAEAMRGEVPSRNAVF